jgi:hypothetical protein
MPERMWEALEYRVALVLLWIARVATNAALRIAENGSTYLQEEE